MAKRKKKKKNCSGSKGYNCGATCISVKYVCHKDGLSGQSVTIAIKMAETIQSVLVEPSKPVEPFLTKSDYDGSYYAFDEVDGIEIYTSFQSTKDNPNSFEVSFSVNNSTDATPNNDLPKKTKRKLAKRVLTNMNKAFAEIPEGSKFYASPYQSDGKGAKRERLYEKFGFSHPTDDTLRDMYAIKKNGKIQPLNGDEFLNFVEASNDKEMERLIYSILFD